MNFLSLKAEFPVEGTPGTLIPNFVSNASHFFQSPTRWWWKVVRFRSYLRRVAKVAWKLWPRRSSTSTSNTRGSFTSSTRSTAADRPRFSTPEPNAWSTWPTTTTRAAAESMIACRPFVLQVNVLNGSFFVYIVWTKKGRKEQSSQLCVGTF